jgi:hypothetical protein
MSYRPADAEDDLVSVFDAANQTGAVPALLGPRYPHFHVADESLHERFD